MDFRTLLQSMYTISEATDRSEPGKVKHSADPGGYGRKDDEDEEGKQVKPASTEKRGKGRPKKATQSSGEDKKYDFSAFGSSGKDVKLPKWDKKKTTKHSIKEYIDQVESAINEEGVTIKPMPGASQIIGADGETMGTADAATANTIKQASEKGTLNLGGGDEQMNEKWDAKMDTPASEKGKYAGKSKGELLKAYNHLKSTGPHKEGSKPYSNMKELAFAIRAKGKFGKVQDEGKLDELDASTVASYQDKAFDKYMGGDEKRAQGLDRASKKQAGAFGHVPTTQPQNVEEAKDLPGKQEKLDVAPPKGKLTGADFKALGKKKVKESLSFTEMMQEAGTDVNDMMAELQQDIDNFNKTGHCSDKLEAFLKIHGHSKKKLAGESIVDRVGFDTPPPIDKNPMTQNPMTTPAFARKQQSQGMPITSPGEDKPFGFMKQISAPTKTFESKDMKDVQLESWEKELTSLLHEGITVTSSQGQQGTPDSVSINATDSDAQELLSIVRQAGLGVFGGGDEQEHSGYGAPMSGDEGGSGTEPQMSPSVVGDGDDMMALIKKMSGIQSDAGPSAGGEEHDHGQDGPDGTLTPDYEEETGEEKTDEGNAFSGAVAKAKQDGVQPGEKISVGGKEYPVKEEEVEEETVNGNGEYQKAEGGSCNECGMFEARCVCSSDKEQVEEYANDAGNEEMAQLKHMLGQGNDLHRQKRNQSVGNPTQVTTETRLFKDTSNLLVDWQKLSGIK